MFRLQAFFAGLFSLVVLVASLAPADAQDTGSRKQTAGKPAKPSNNPAPQTKSGYVGTQSRPAAHGTGSKCLLALADEVIE
jgi:hypothetical protein